MGDSYAVYRDALIFLRALLFFRKLFIYNRSGQRLTGESVHDNILIL